VVRETCSTFLIHSLPMLLIGSTIIIVVCNVGSWPLPPPFYSSALNPTAVFVLPFITYSYVEYIKIDEDNMVIIHWRFHSLESLFSSYGAYVCVGYYTSANGWNVCCIGRITSEMYIRLMVRMVLRLRQRCQKPKNSIFLSSDSPN
jgi:hypothetical protein